jgi:hypothetical protein
MMTTDSSHVTKFTAMVEAAIDYRNCALATCGILFRVSRRHRLFCCDAHQQAHVDRVRLSHLKVVSNRRCHVARRRQRSAQLRMVPSVRPVPRPAAPPVRQCFLSVYLPPRGDIARAFLGHHVVARL